MVERMTVFFKDDSGAVVVDWVALTAGTLMLGIAVLFAIYNTGVASLTIHVNDVLSGSIGITDPGNVDDLVAANTGTGG